MVKVNAKSVGKELHIKFSAIGEEPKYTFVGEWVGADVRVASALMRREYRHYTAGKRGADKQASEQPVVQSQEA